MVHLSLFFILQGSIRSKDHEDIDDELVAEYVLSIQRNLEMPWNLILKTSVSKYVNNL